MGNEQQQVVELQRSVRYGRLLIGCAVVGALIASLITIFFPVVDGKFYTLGQIAGFMLLVGGVIGLAVGGILSLILTIVARRNRGTGVVSIETAAAVDASAGTEAEATADDSEATGGARDSGPASASAQ